MPATNNPEDIMSYEAHPEIPGAWTFHIGLEFENKQDRDAFEAKIDRVLFKGRAVKLGEGPDERRTVFHLTVMGLGDNEETVKATRSVLCNALVQIADLDEPELDDIAEMLTTLTLH